MIRGGQTFYYSDESTDDFQNTKTVYNVTVDSSYKYTRSPLFYFFSGLFYYLLIMPILLIYTYIFKGTRVHGRKNLKAVKKGGYFMYANHTNIDDSFLGAVNIAAPKRTYIIGNKDAISIPVADVIVKWLGCLPVPDTAMGLKNLSGEITRLISKKKAIMIFPEAHIWHYYTGIRPFPVTGFKFAAKCDAPAVPVAVKYRKRLFGRPAMDVYIGEAVYPDANLSVRENAEAMRDKVFSFIEAKVGESDNYSYVRYQKIDK